MQKLIEYLTNITINYYDPALWVLLAFFVFIFLVAKPSLEMINQALDNYSRQVNNNFLMAENKLREAELLLQNHQARATMIEEKINKIITHASEEGERINNNSRQKSIELISYCEANADKLIHDLEQRALQNLIKSITVSTIDTVNNNIQNDFSKSDHQKLNNFKLAV